MSRLDRWRTIVNGHSAEKTITKRGAEKWVKLAREQGWDARVERTRLCPTCGCHGCPDGADCPDAGEVR